MNLRDFQYLIAVAQFQHFGKAAEICHVSQPALSMQIRKLEQSLGVQLFERNNKNVRITQAGEAILERAKKLLMVAEEIQQTAHSFQNPLAGDFKLGAFPTLAPYYLPKIVPLIHKRLTQLKLFLIEEKTQNLLTMLKTGGLDAALIALPVPDEALICQPLFKDPFLLAVPKNHLLASKKFATMQDLDKDELLLLEEGHCLRDQALEYCAMAGTVNQNEFRATSMETLRQMVVAGVGITLIPECAAHPSNNIHYLRFRKNIPSRTIGLVYRKHAAKEICIKKLLEILRTPESHKATSA